ncbi:TRDC protein, partial [Ceuthmochares aereus]|nr:TRDC protein [Ceuthmochares aereus]
LKSKTPKQHENKLNVACLAKAFYPKNISLDMSQGDLVYELKAPLVTSKGTYGTMKVVGVDADAEVTCKAVHKAADSLILPGTALGPEHSGISLALFPLLLLFKADVQMEKVNMLFMAVWGLRFLLVKSIAFNMILSIKLLHF